jgi:hypothetical protein
MSAVTAVRDVELSRMGNDIMVSGYLPNVE